MKNTTLNWRVKQLEKCYSEMEAKLDKILENHLPHINEELSSLKTRINVQTTIQVGAVVAGALILKYL